MKAWYRATIRTPSHEKNNRIYYESTNVYLCPCCGPKAKNVYRVAVSLDTRPEYYKVIKRTQEVFHPVRCFECKKQAPKKPPVRTRRPIWKKP